MSIFLTGTDTGVGKTHSAAALLLRYADTSLRYWKPVQTGDDDDRATVLALSGMDAERFVDTGWSFAEALSPHRAAELEERADEITVARLLARLQRLRRAGPLLIEGAGGLLVPLHRGLRETWLDFARAAGLPLVIAARSGLGTINHTLLTLRECERAGLTVAGVIFCGPDNPDNRRTIAEFSGATDLGCFDLGAHADPRDLDAGAIDPSGRLAEFIR